MTQQEFDAYEALTADEQLEIRSKMSDAELVLHSCECVLHRIHRISERHEKGFNLMPQERSAHYLSDVGLLLPFAMDYTEKVIKVLRIAKETDQEQNPSSPPA